MFQIEERVNECFSLKKDNRFNTNIYLIFYLDREIGFFNFLYWGRLCYLHQFELEKEFRHRGIGSLIYSFFEIQIKKKGIRKIYLISIQDAFHFWRGRGFLGKGEKNEGGGILLYKRI